MKRTAIQRRTPLRQAKPARYVCADRCAGDIEESTPTCSRCEGEALPVLTGRPVAQVPRNKRGKRRDGPEWRYIRRHVINAANGICERCGEFPASEVHHRVTRARGGIHHPANLAALCAGPGTNDCHGLVHAFNEVPWLLPGAFIGGVYVGPWEPFVERFGRSA